MYTGAASCAFSTMFLVGPKSRLHGLQYGLQYLKYPKHVASSSNVPAKETAQTASVAKPISFVLLFANAMNNEVKC